MQSKSVRASGDMGSRGRLPSACAIVRSLGAVEHRLGRNADGEHDEIAFEDASICEGGRDRARLVRFGRLARVSCSTCTIRFGAVRVCGFVTKGTFVRRGYNGQVQAHQKEPARED